MKTIIFAIITISALALSGCASLPTNYKVSQEMFSGIPADATILFVVDSSKGQVCPTTLKGVKCAEVVPFDPPTKFQSFTNPDFVNYYFKTYPALVAEQLKESGCAASFTEKQVVTQSSSGIGTMALQSVNLLAAAVVPGAGAITTGIAQGLSASSGSAVTTNTIDTTRVWYQILYQKGGTANAGCEETTLTDECRVQVLAALAARNQKLDVQAAK